MSDTDKSDFDDWLKNPITIEIFNIFIENKEFLKEKILTLDVLNDIHLDRQTAYLRGGLDICDEFLNITFDQLFKKEEVKSENEETLYSW